MSSASAPALGPATGPDPWVDPPEHAVVLFLDEKSQIQALDRTQPGLPMKKGRCGQCNAVIRFVIVAFAVFILVKQINRLKREEPAAPAPPPEPPRQEVLLAEIRDLLKARA